MTSGQGNSVGDLMDQDAGSPPAPEPADDELLERFVSRRDESKIRQKSGNAWGCRCLYIGRAYCLSPPPLRGAMPRWLLS